MWVTFSEFQTELTIKSSKGWKAKQLKCDKKNSPNVNNVSKIQGKNKTNITSTPNTV